MPCYMLEIWCAEKMVTEAEKDMKMIMQSIINVA